jgi:hypothetical protein
MEHLASFQERFTIPRHLEEIQKQRKIHEVEDRITFTEGRKAGKIFVISEINYKNGEMTIHPIDNPNRTSNYYTIFSPIITHFIGPIQQ